MKVIQLTSGDVEGALRRLAAEMLNLECGAVAYGPDLSRLPGPWAPYPVVTVPPVTAKGLPCQVHYQPASGVVYYTRRAGDSVWAWVQRLRELLGGAGVGHLEGPRAVAATPQGVFRARAQVSDWSRARTRLADPDDESKQAVVYREVRVPRSEDFGNNTDLNHYNSYSPPPISSPYAAFTWHFEPAVYLALMGGRDHLWFDGRLVNAMVAGVLFDVGGASALADGASTLTPTGVFALPEPPFPSWGGEGVHYRVNGQRSSGYPQQTDGLFVLRPRGGAPLSVGAPLSGPPHGAYYQVTYVVHAPGLRPRSAGKDREPLPFAQWDPSTILQPFSCIHCGVPIGGRAILIRGMRHPAAQAHPGKFCGGSPWGRLGLIIPAACRQTGVLLCPQCWNSSCDLRAHLAASIYQTEVPLSQAASGACIGMTEGAVALLSGKAYPVADVPGAFVVFLAEEPPCPEPTSAAAGVGRWQPGAAQDCEGDAARRAMEGIGLVAAVAAQSRGQKVLMTGASLGPFPSALLAELARLAVPSLSDLRLAVQAWPGQENAGRGADRPGTAAEGGRGSRR